MQYNEIDHRSTDDWKEAEDDPNTLHCQIYRIISGISTVRAPSGNSTVMKRR